MSKKPLLELVTPEQKYKLNVDCKRTRDRVNFYRRVVVVRGYENGAHRFHHDELTLLIGNRSSKVAQALRTSLDCRYNYIVGKQPSRYVMLKDVYAKLTEPFGPIKIFNNLSEYLELLMWNDAERINQVKQQIKNKHFEYEETACGRYYHPLNNVRRIHKQEVFTSIGLPYDYDIEACAPSLLVQYAINSCGFSEDAAQPILFYINNRSYIRDESSRITGLDKLKVKKLINALFYGGRFSFNNNSILYQETDNVEQRRYFINNEYYQQLRHSIKLMWKSINTVEKVKAVTGRQKSMVYYRYERQITDIMDAFCKERGIWVLLEHDGIRTSDKIATLELEKVINEKTGFSIKLDGNAEEVESNDEFELSAEELDSCCEEDEEALALI